MRERIPFSVDPRNLSIWLLSSCSLRTCISSHTLLSTLVSVMVRILQMEPWSRDFIYLWLRWSKKRCKTYKNYVWVVSYNISEEHNNFSSGHWDVNTFLQYVIIPLQKTLRRDKIPILFQLLLPKFYHKKDGVNSCFE